MFHHTRNVFLLVSACLLTLAVSPLRGQEAAAVEKKSRQLFELKKTISAEESSWNEQKELFAGLIELREAEVGKIDEFTATAEKRIEEVKKKRAELKDEEASRREWRAGFEKRLAELEDNLRPQLKRFPSPLRRKIEGSILRMEDTDSELPLQDRFRDVISILGTAAEFQNQITIDADLREIGGKEVEVETLYLGLSQAFYVDRTGKTAGTGTPTAEGWTWKEDPTLGAKIREAIAIQRRETQPAFVELPIEGGQP